MPSARLKYKVNGVGRKGDEVNDPDGKLVPRLAVPIGATTKKDTGKKTDGKKTKGEESAAKADG